MDGLAGIDTAEHPHEASYLKLIFPRHVVVSNWHPVLHLEDS